MVISQRTIMRAVREARNRAITPLTGEGLMSALKSLVRRDFRGWVRLAKIMFRRNTFLQVNKGR